MTNPRWLTETKKPFVWVSVLAVLYLYSGTLHAWQLTTRGWHTPPRSSDYVMRRHPVIVSAMALIVMIWAVEFGPVIFFAVVILSMAAAGVSGGARRKIPPRDLLLYVGISVLLVIALLVWVEISSRSGR